MRPSTSVSASAFLAHCVENRLEYLRFILFYLLIYYYYFFDSGTQFPGNEKNYAMQYKKYKKSSWNEPHSSSFTKHTHTHPFNGPFSWTTRVGRYRKDKTNLDFTEARDSEWQWHQLGHMQVCTLLQTDNHASTSPLSFLQADALPAAQPTASKH